jgi:hypothetical protein
MSNVTEMKPQSAPGSPDWDALEREVLLRIQLLRGAWKGTQEDSGDVHAMMVRDLYMPALNKLAQFCSMIEVEEDKEEA